MVFYRTITTTTTTTGKNKKMLSRTTLNSSTRLAQHLSSYHSKLSTSTGDSSIDLPSTAYSTTILPVRPSTSSNPRPTSSSTSGDRSNLAVAALLSRSPLLLRPLSEFESAYYDYQRHLNRALSKPIRPSFFFRTGSQAAKAFELAARASSSPTPSLQPPTNTSSSSQNDPLDPSTTPEFQNIERNPHRSIYLLIQLFNHHTQQASWQLPTSPLLPTKDTLTKASLRALHTSLGPNMDIWSIGKVPATVYSPPPSSSSSVQVDNDGMIEKVWVMPLRILRGNPKLSPRSTDDSLKKQVTVGNPNPSDLTNTQATPAVDHHLEDPRPLAFGWFTAQEVQDRVDPEIWKALEPILLQ